MLVERLRSHGIEPVLVREPGGTAISEKIREILLSPEHNEMVPRTEILLYEAARAQLVHQKLIPLLKKGEYLIADRFFDSTTAYQGYGRGLDLSVVQMLNRFATSGLVPYRTFFIDISPEEAERRWRNTRQPGDRLESGGREFFRRIREGFLMLCESEKHRFLRIDGERPPEEIAADIWNHLRPLWNLPGG